MTEMQAAIVYNVKASKTIWKQDELPWAWSSIDVNAEEFARVTVIFQQSHGLKSDGKLGPATLAVIREVMLEPYPDGDTQTVNGPSTVPPVRPVRVGVSNNLILDNKRVPLSQVLLNSGVTASNWLDDGEAHFTARIRTKKVEHVVIHESVTRDAPTTVRVLKNNGYGVHLMVCPDGHVSCHNDLVLDQPIHGNQLNGSSIGLEVVNPYTAKILKAPFTQTIPADWWTWVPSGAPKKYTLPTDSQMRTIKTLIPWLADILPDLPYAFPTKELGKQQPKIPNWDKGAKPTPGIVAHRDFASHADGRWILEELMKGG